MVKRLQNRIAQSRWALPITIIYGLVVCLTVELMGYGQWMTFALLLVATLMMAELNNGYSLIRIYSRMVSCSFMVMITMSLTLFESVTVAVVMVAFIAFLLLIFRAYQNPGAVGWVFYAFVALGISSIVFSKSLLFVPVLWVIMAVNVLCFSPRTLIASLLGIITPYWFVAAWLIYQGNISYLGTHFLSALQFGTPFQFSILNIHQLLTFAFVLVELVIVINAIFMQLVNIPGWATSWERLISRDYFVNQSLSFGPPPGMDKVGNAWFYYLYMATLTCFPLGNGEWFFLPAVWIGPAIAFGTMIAGIPLCYYWERRHIRMDFLAFTQILRMKKNARRR